MEDDIFDKSLKAIDKALKNTTQEKLDEIFKKIDGKFEGPTVGQYMNHLENAMKKKCQVHMLPTKNHSHIVHSTSKYGGLFKSEYYSPMLDMGDSYQHLYFTTDEEIKEGDWYLFFATGLDYAELMQCRDKEEANRCNNHFFIKRQCKKIIATTNSELWFMGGGSTIGGTWKPYGGTNKIDNTFVEAYIKAYNEGTPIKEVMVEYEQLCHQTGTPCGFPCNGEDNCKESFYVKLNPVGSVIIHPVSEDEMMEMMEMMDVVLEYLKSKYSITPLK